jgi:general secretion pathway protein F
MRYKYVAMSMDGRAFEEERDATDLSAIVAELKRRGLILVSHSEIKPAGTTSFFTATVKPRAITAFLAELSLMLRSGLPLIEALDLASQDIPAVLARTIKSVRAAVIDGASFVQALERHGEVFGPEIIAMARVAEATGDLEGVLKAIAAQRERSHALAEKVGGALRYPAFLIVTAVLVLLFFLLHVIPQFTGVVSEMHGDPGALVNFVFGLSNWLVAHEDMLLICAALALSLGFAAWRIPRSRIAIIGFLANLPLIRGIWRTRRAAVFLSNLAVLVGQGVPMTAALKVLESVVGSDGAPALAKLGDSVRQGGRLYEGAAAVNLLPSVAVRMLRIGEETGELAKVAGEAGALYSHKLEQRLEKLTGIIGPAAILAIAFLIGGMMVAIMSTIVSVNQMAL